MRGRDEGALHRRESLALIAALSLPKVQAAIAKAKPLITGFAERVITNPVGGVGLK